MAHFGRLPALEPTDRRVVVGASTSIALQSLYLRGVDPWQVSVAFLIGLVLALCAQGESGRSTACVMASAIVKNICMTDPLTGARATQDMSL